MTCRSPLATPCPCATEQKIIAKTTSKQIVGIRIVGSPNAEFSGSGHVGQIRQGSSTSFCGSEGSLVITSLRRAKASKICLRFGHWVPAPGLRWAKAGGSPATSFDEHVFAMILQPWCHHYRSSPITGSACVQQSEWITGNRQYSRSRQCFI